MHPYTLVYIVFVIDIYLLLSCVFLRLFSALIRTILDTSRPFVSSCCLQYRHLPLLSFSLARCALAEVQPKLHHANAPHPFSRFAGRLCSCRVCCAKCGPEPQAELQARSESRGRWPPHEGAYARTGQCVLLCDTGSVVQASAPSVFRRIVALRPYIRLSSDMLLKILTFCLFPSLGSWHACPPYQHHRHGLSWRQPQPHQQRALRQQHQSQVRKGKG